MRLMIVRQSEKCAERTACSLESVGFGADAYSRMSDAAEALASNPYDLVVVERDLRDGDGLAWLRGTSGRRPPASTSVILLSDREEERVAALEAGADDSAKILVSERELTARIRAVLRRPRQRVERVLTFADISFCTTSREVRVAEQVVSMQRRETAILEALIRRAGRVVPRAALEHDIYGVQADFCPNSLEVRISRIRHHLVRSGSSTRVEAVRGVGYKLSESEREGERLPKAPALPAKCVAEVPQDLVAA